MNIRREKTGKEESEERTDGSINEMRKEGKHKGIKSGKEKLIDRQISLDRDGRKKKEGNL